MPKPIQTEADYEIALAEISHLIDIDPERETPDGDRLDVLGKLVQAYEAKHYPIPAPDFIDETTIVLTRRESMRLFELMENPPPRNEAFLRAQARHRELLGGHENEEPDVGSLEAGGAG